MSEPTNHPSKFWLDLVAEKISTHYSTGKIVLSSGISPSAHYHIGHFREILTTEAIAWKLRQIGRDTVHIHVVDDFDPLRKRYDFLPKEYEKYIGWPLIRVPDPNKDCHKSYAEHFYAEFEAHAHEIGINPSQVVRNSELYASGKMTTAIEDVLTKINKVKEIFASVSGRKLDDDWTPLQIETESGKYIQGSLYSWDKSAKTINDVSYTGGRVKMNWRLEWPARWRVLGVMVEPFSHQEHGAAGGSYETGMEFARQIFDIEPPKPGVRYGTIHIKGDSKKMSSSKGNLYTPSQVLEVMPAEILRYFVIKSRPEKQLDFDLYLGLYNLLEEYSKTEIALNTSSKPEFAEAVEFARDLSGGLKQTISSVPFNHLVFAYQAARGDKNQTLSILKRTGFDSVVEKEKAIISSELKYVSIWLSKYAPDKIKFELQEELPKLELDSAGLRFLDLLVEKLKDGQHEAQYIHESIYESATAVMLKPTVAFKLLYQLFLNKSSGPKLGFFLATLEKDFVIKRLLRLA